MMLFGRKTKARTLFWWGARAIYHQDCPWALDIPPDRFSETQATFPEGMRQDNIALRNSYFDEWIKRKGLPAVNTWLKKNNITLSSTEVYQFQDGARVIEASPNGSYGYIYIGAWELL